MNIVWIIGNGFDQNVGLNTSYWDFLDECYLKGNNPLRDDLVAKVGDPKDGGCDCWSDLERLLGYAAQYYETDGDRFHRTFEDMQARIVKYVSEQEATLPKDIPDTEADEFCSSVVRLYERMVEKDQERFPIQKTLAANVVHHFISLNYTHTLDQYLEAAKSLHNPLCTRRVSNSVYEDRSSSVLHLHGEVLDGDGNGIVFGVSQPDEISGELLCGDDTCLELWIKSEKNARIYGNTKTERMVKTIGGANVICIYGCSMGRSDSYIWHEVGRRLDANNSVKVVLFVSGLPGRRGLNAYEYQLKRDEALRSFVNETAWSGGADANLASARDRVFVLPSGDYFKFSCCP